ncbi:hypothetical protein EDB81DRAFT_771218 [Dactylonectria macrodidyma]|uniref:Uncharacterized protein n=1 Tax=Dactylonectria macrodidyma TaxID=307937 RepID=A0A9P9FTS8_9HYPO|nr:hypothetical protein EDB81DRAFT_771218 [Dactylonectria macrodidyma]
MAPRGAHKKRRCHLHSFIQASICNNNCFEPQTPPIIIMNNSPNQNPRATRDSGPNQRGSAYKPRKRGTRGARRAGSSGSNAREPQQQGKEIHDPAARQQMKQTIAMALITTPVLPLPFPLSMVLGLTTLVYPSGTKNRDESE